MQTEPTSEPTGSRVPGVMPEPIRPRNPLARLASALRGDKYMVGAYPPEWRGAERAVSGTKGR